MEKRKKELGQYFTPSYVADFMVNLIDGQPASILEPSCGEGVFIDKLLQNGVVQVVGYEVDATLPRRSHVRYKSFIGEDVKEQFDVVIGNPPYIRWRNLTENLKKELQGNELWNKYFNSLCDYLYIFILKSVECLKPGGQLIFICPSYWFSTTHAESLRNYLVENGTFREIYLFKETLIFSQVASSLTVFKYVKNGSDDQIKVTIYDDRLLTVDALIGFKSRTLLSKVTYIDIDQFKKNERWVIADRETQINLRNFNKNSIPLGLVAKIGNGLVTGLDAAFQIPENKTLTDYEKTKTIKIVKGKSLEQFIYRQTIDYIFAQDLKDDGEFEELCPNFKSLLTPYVDALKRRYCYGLDICYWHWVFLRNYNNLFKIPKPRILVPGKERVSHKNYFRFAYAPANVYSTQDVTCIIPNNEFKEGIEYLLAILNSGQVFKWVIYNGIIKGAVVEFSEKPLSEIPIRRIDWSNAHECHLHAEIVCLVKLICDNQSVEINKVKLQQLLNELLK